MRSVQYIPTRDRSRMMTAPASGFAVIGVISSLVACIGLGVSAALRLYGGFAWAPVLAEAASAEAPHAANTTASVLWLTVWNIVVPAALSVITLIVFLKWRSRENTTQY